LLGSFSIIEKPIYVTNLKVIYYPVLLFLGEFTHLAVSCLEHGEEALVRGDIFFGGRVGAWIG
jgi:hypothetical protein